MGLFNRKQIFKVHAIGCCVPKWHFFRLLYYFYCMHCMISSVVLYKVFAGLLRRDDLFKRIVGGEESNPHQWPWQVQLQVFAVTTANVGWTHLCGGSLIGVEWVVTAAHCVVKRDKSLLRVKLGEHDIDRHDVGHETLHSISTIHYHELFPTLLPLNDIAVLQISPAANLSRVVQTIALPKHRYKVPNGLKCIAKGWGDTSKSTIGQGAAILRHVELPVVSHNVCAAKNKGYVVSLSKNICAGEEFSKGRGCYGDSGGGLVCIDSSGNWALQGIVSWGYKYCSPKFYTVFTRVSSFINWINGKMKKATRNVSVPP